MLIQTQVEFQPEFNRRLRFTANDRADKRLSDAYDPVCDPVGMVIKHVLLLIVDFSNRIQQALFPVLKLIALFLHEAVDISHVTLHITKLFANDFADL